MLTKEQWTRYNRQVILPQIGVEGQKRLLDSRVLVIGAGGLGAPVLAYLTSAGVGTIGIVDADAVEMSNLQRQIIHSEYSIGRQKTSSAIGFLSQLNSEICINEHPVFLSPENAKDIIGEYDLIINGTDNFPTRYLVNDCCVLLQKPLIDASVLKFDGQATVFLPGEGCYRCLYPSIPSRSIIKNCSENGVIGPLVGMMGSLQAVEALKVLLRIGNPLSGKLIMFDSFNGEFNSIKWSKNPKCPLCGDNPTITDLSDDYGINCETKQIDYSDEWDLDLETLNNMRPFPDIIDLRDNVEFHGKLPLHNSKIISFEEVLIQFESWDRERLIVFICDIGIRSSALTEMLRSKGFKLVYHLRGGISHWL
ncbi:molybdopterin-synthase adenylyltransferase MoeB [Paenibacillus algorifonticola]|uniref:molybdopterin-synthase adenylyltransferase MoeB n=1 Tax=Paenibacillus algorifonticola TaxID=684063 RepID=UPI003D2E30D1